MSITYVNMLKKAKELDILIKDHTDKKTKIAVGGNCSTEFLIPGLRVKLDSLKIQAEVLNLEYNSWLSVIQRKEISADIWIIWLSSLGATNGGTESYSFDFASIKQAINYLTINKSKVVLILPEKMEISKDLYCPLYKEYIDVRNTLMSLISPEVLIVDPEIIHTDLGSAAWYAGRYWSFSKIVCHPNAVAQLSWYTGNLLAKSIKPEVKAIIVDLDNTLWGGVVGEDGVDNLQLDVNAEGRSYIKMQFLLKQLAKNGIPISVVSKNNLEDAKAPFLTREEMLLKLDDFVYFVANWQHKSKNIQEIANKLKLNVDSICFIDDSVYERAEVRAALPSLIIPELPGIVDDRIGMLINSGMFVAPNLSNEDLERAVYYKSDLKREEYLSEVVDFDQYLQHLEMTLEPIAVDESNIQRVVSLINRTNQFNLTNRRHTAPEVQAFIADSDAYAYCYRLQDKFGDSGIIGVLLAKKHNNKIRVDTFLMSCRVLNRKVEHAIFDHFVQWTQAKGLEYIEAEYISSPKNVLTKDLYSNFGLKIIQTTEEKTLYAAEKVVVLEHPIKIS